MRRLLIVSLLLALSMPLLAQNDKALLRKLKAVEAAIARYDTLPFDPYDTLESTRDLILRETKELVQHPRMTAELAERHLSPGSMAFSRSADDRIWLFSIDERTGGSFRSRIAFMRYIDADGRIRIAEDLSSFVESEEDDSDILNMGYCSQLEQLDDSTYFTDCSVRGCGACLTHEAYRVVIRNGEPRFSLIHRFDGWQGFLETFTFDMQTRSFQFSYVLEKHWETVSEEIDYIWHKGSMKYIKGRFWETEHCATLVDQPPNFR